MRGQLCRFKPRKPSTPPTLPVHGLSGRSFFCATLDGSWYGLQISPMATNLTEANFNSEVIESDQPVLVDFWAEWCGPCKMIGPVLDQLSGEIEGQAKIAKVNVDEARELAVKYNVKSIPLLLFFKNGEVKDQIVGANVTKDQLKAKLLALA
jgi:thioredoxin 1